MAAELTHDQLVEADLRQVLPVELAQIVKTLAGSCTFMHSFDEEAERRNDPLLLEIAKLDKLYTALDKSHRAQRYHPGQYQKRDSGHAKWLDRDEMDWFDCCQLEVKQNNNYANQDLIGCKWRGPEQPHLQTELDELQAKIATLTKRVVCSCCKGNHSGRGCSYRRCGFCLTPNDGMYNKYDCSDCRTSRDRVLAPQRKLARQALEKELQIRNKELRTQEAVAKVKRQQANREQRKRQRRLEPCGKFHAGLCKRGDKCSRSHE